MPRRRSGRAVKPLGAVNRPTPSAAFQKTHEKQKPSGSVDVAKSDADVEVIPGIRSVLDDENVQPGTSRTVEDLSANAAALHDELDSFRQRWKRELRKPSQLEFTKESKDKSDRDRNKSEDPPNSSHASEPSDSKDGSLGVSNPEDDAYVEARKLFLTAVDLEQDEMHHESIRYYKQAMHLYPDIEKRIFKEQCEASAREQTPTLVEELDKTQIKNSSITDGKPDEEQIDILNRIIAGFNSTQTSGRFTYCQPMQRLKPGSVHISDLPHEMLLQIFRHIIGEELDLASLESVGLVCRGFYLLSRDSSLWRSVCYNTWKENLTIHPSRAGGKEIDHDELAQIDWRQVYLDRPRVNFDGVYISRTRYIRQGDVGFQDITYRPFHVIRYYRYLRFFPDRRVLILTTNEEPDKIIPIFRHALQARQFSSELSVLDGTYELTGENQVHIVAEKDCLASSTAPPNQRRQASVHWSRQTPITQKFNLKFELKTVSNKPYRNNVLKWLDYTILARFESSQEVTSFDVSQDSFPSLVFSRVKRFNLRTSNPLASH